MNHHELLGVSHYFQKARSQPAAITLSENMYCIEIVTGGRGWLVDTDDWIEVAEGAVLWHRPGEKTIARSDEEDPYRCLAIRIYSEQAFESLPRKTEWRDFDEIKRFTREAVSLYVDEKFPNEILLQYLIHRIQFQIRLYEHIRRNDRLPVTVQRSLQLIDTKYGEKVSLDSLADVAGCSVPHLHAMFQKHLSASPHQLLMARRIRAAKERLASSDQPIKQIAIECGFSSAAAFCSTFARFSGQTPAAYRRERYWLDTTGS